MNEKQRNRIAIISVLLFGIGLLFFATDGFQAYTVETARVNQLMEDNPVFPDVTLEDSREQTYPFSEFQGKYVMLTFIYTTCSDVCLDLEANLAEVYESVPDNYLEDDIMFLSISFDPTRDTPEVLEIYGSHFGSDGDTWRMARINDQEELDSLLNEFGVIVIPEENGHYQHNSAFYLVDPNGILIEIMDYTDIEGSSEKVINILEENEVSES